jgi:hypothetical protein
MEASSSTLTPVLYMEGKWVKTVDSKSNKTTQFNVLVDKSGIKLHAGHRMKDDHRNDLPNTSTPTTGVFSEICTFTCSNLQLKIPQTWSDDNAGVLEPLLGFVSIGLSAPQFLRLHFVRNG